MIRINLVPKEERGKSEKKVDWNRMTIILAAGLTALVVGFGFFNHVLTDMYRDKADRMVVDMATLRREQGVLNTFKGDNATLRKDLDAAKQFVRLESNERFIKTLTELSKATPSDVWLSQLFMIADTSVTTAGYAARPVDLSLLLKELELVTGVREVNLPSFGWWGEGSSRLQVFSLRMMLERD